MCLLVKFAKFLTKPILTSICKRLPLIFIQSVSCFFPLSNSVMLRVTYLKDINENKDIKKMLLIKKWNIYNIYDQLSINLWVWSRSVNFRLRFSLQGFCVLYFILSRLLTKDFLEYIYCQSNLLDRMLRLHSYQPSPRNYCTNT